MAALFNKPTYVTTVEFWNLMCNVSFVRTSKHTGRISSKDFYVGIYPEMNPNFIDSIKCDIAKLLQF